MCTVHVAPALTRNVLFMCFSCLEISWDLFPFPDCKETIEILDHQVFGVLSILDDLCRTPKAVDSTFASAVYQQCSFHPSFEASSRHAGMKCFSIKHFAGHVEYDTNGFVEKNKDEIPRETIELLMTSTNTFVRRLGAIMMTGRVENSYEIAQGERHAFGLTSQSLSSQTKRPTAGKKFKRQLSLLRKKIDQTSPHFIRCIKPNDNFEHDSVNPGLIAKQLRCAGVLEVVRLSRVGYSQRFLHSNFISRYQMLLESDLPSYGDVSLRNLCHYMISKSPLAEMDPRNYGDLSLRSLCEYLVSESPFADQTTDGIKVGKTKVFLRQQAFHSLESTRSRKLRQAAVNIQKLWRLHVAERAYIITYCCVLMLQSNGRRYFAKRHVESTLNANHHPKRYWQTKMQRAAVGRDLNRRQDDLQLLSADNAEMRDTIRWLAQNVVALRNSMSSYQRCYNEGDTDAWVPSKLRRHGPLASVQINGLSNDEQYFLLKEENELLRQSLYDFKDEIRAMREIVMGDNLSTLSEDHQVLFSAEEKGRGNDSPVSTEMQFLRKEIERMRKEIIKTKNNINNKEPVYECNLNMLNAALHEINALKEESLNLRERIALHT